MSEQEEREVVLRVDETSMGALLEAAKALAREDRYVVLVALVWAVWVRWEALR